MKNISVWYNRYGIDEEYFSGEFEKYDKESLKVICNNCDKLFSKEENIDELFGEFEKVYEGEGCVMYGFDGVGIFVVDKGYDVERCKDEYNKVCDLE